MLTITYRKGCTHVYCDTTLQYVRVTRAAVVKALVAAKQYPEKGDFMSKAQLLAHWRLVAREK